MNYVQHKSIITLYQIGDHDYLQIRRYLHNLGKNLQ